MDKRELLDDIRREHEALDARVAQLDDAQISEPALDNGWSMKDLVAHLSLWERTCAKWLDAVARGETPARPEILDDGMNVREYEASKDATRASILAAAHSSRQAVLRAVAALSDADLADEQRFGWPAWQMVRSNTSEHYREHAGQLTRR
jgi:hypothetical protein